MLQKNRFRFPRLVILASVAVFGILIMPTSRCATAASIWNSSCIPDGVMVYSSRIHIRCAAAVAGIQYFAVSTDDKDHAARVLNTISTAQALGRTVSILYDPAVTTNLPVGCQSSDCRTLLAVGFGQ